MATLKSMLYNEDCVANGNLVSLEIGSSISVCQNLTDRQPESTIPFHA